VRGRSDEPGTRYGHWKHRGEARYNVASGFSPAAMKGGVASHAAAISMSDTAVSRLSDGLVSRNGKSPVYVIHRSDRKAQRTSGKNRRKLLTEAFDRFCAQPAPSAAAVARSGA